MRITKEPEERRQEIFDAALKLFGEKGYEKITITDIAEIHRSISGPLLPLFSIQRSIV